MGHNCQADRAGGEAAVYHGGESAADPGGEFVPAFAARTPAGTAAVYPCAVGAVAFHFPEIPALKDAKVHLPQSGNGGLPDAGKQDGGGLYGSGEGGDKEGIRGEVRLLQRCPACRGEGDLGISLIASFRVAGGGAMPQQVDQHGNRPFST